MMKKLSLFLLLLAWMVPNAGHSQPKVTVTSHPIWAIYTHGGDLPELSEVKIEFKSEEKEPWTITLLGLSYVRATFNGKGGVVSKDEQPIAFTFDGSALDSLGNPMIELAGGSEWKQPLTFAPIRVEANYHHNWQGFVLDYKVGGWPYKVWVEVNAEREEPYGED